MLNGNTPSDLAAHDADEFDRWAAATFGAITSTPEDFDALVAELRHQEMPAPTLLPIVKVKGSKSPRYMKVKIPTELRWAVWERDNFTCRHCGSRRSLAVDHIYPESRGGATTLDNLQTLCKRCNSRKGAKL